VTWWSRLPRVDAVRVGERVANLVLLLRGGGGTEAKLLRHAALLGAGSTMRVGRHEGRRSSLRDGTLPPESCSAPSSPHLRIIVVVGDDDAIAIARIVELVEHQNSTVVHVKVLPGTVDSYLGAIARAAVGPA
jgi:hypothetical protein